MHLIFCSESSSRLCFSEMWWWNLWNLVKRLWSGSRSSLLYMCLPCLSIRVSVLRIYLRWWSLLDLILSFRWWFHRRRSIWRLFFLKIFTIVLALLILFLFFRFLLIRVFRLFNNFLMLIIFGFLFLKRVGSCSNSLSRMLQKLLKFSDFIFQNYSLSFFFIMCLNFLVQFFHKHYLIHP